MSIIVSTCDKVTCDTVKKKKNNYLHINDFEFVLIYFLYVLKQNKRLFFVCFAHYQLFFCRHCSLSLQNCASASQGARQTHESCSEWGENLAAGLSELWRHCSGGLSLLSRWQ